MKLEPGSFATKNARHVTDDEGVIVGEVRILRTSGWRGGPTYFFNPNAVGLGRGYKYFDSTSIKHLIGIINRKYGRGE